MTTETKIRVALADDQRILREGLRIILSAASDIEVVGEAEDGVSATELALKEQPDVMLLDIRMPQRDGITATAMIRQARPQIRVLLLTTYDLPEQVVAGLRAGAAGYLLKDCSSEELCSAIRSVARGQTLVQAQSITQLLASFQPAPVEEKPVNEFELTERERDVLRLIAQGKNNVEIAKALYVSESTIKTHINHIFSKLGARDRAHAVVLAHQHGLA